MNIQANNANQTPFKSTAKYLPNLPLRTNLLLGYPSKEFVYGDCLLERLTNMIKQGTLKKIEEDIFELGEDKILLEKTESQLANPNQITIEHGEQAKDGHTVIRRDTGETDSFFDSVIELLRKLTEKKLRLMP